MELLGYSVEILLFLFSVALVAGFIDTLVGGGGLITIPALIAGGVPLLQALATNRLQGSVGTATASIVLIRDGILDVNSISKLLPLAFAGSVLGTLVVQLINTKVLSFVVPLVLILIAGYFLLSSGPQNTKENIKSRPRLYKLFVIPFIGLYAGMFGPATGSFFTLAGVSLKNEKIITSTAKAKSLNCTTNIASLFVFLFSGKVIWIVGLTMIMGQVLGASFGAKTLCHVKPVYLRWLIVFVCIVMIIKYFYSMDWT